MRSILLLGVILLATGCGGRQAPVALDQLADSEAVKVLRGDTSSYRVIYHPGVDLAKKPGS